MDLAPYTIAEIASAHQGDIEKLKYLSKKALESKFAAVKIQVYQCEELLTQAAAKSTRLKKNELKPCEWHGFFDWFNELRLRSRDCTSVDLIVEPFGLQSLEIVSGIVGIDGYKLPTSDTQNTRLLKAILNTSAKSVYIGTGGAYLSEIDATIDYIREIESSSEIFLTHGFQSYPTELHDSDLWKIKFLSNRYGMKVGFADHASAVDSISRNICSCLALYNGASFIEKHIICERKEAYSDYFSSITPEEFDYYFESLGTTMAILSSVHLLDADGHSQYTLGANERRYRDNMKKYACAAHDILAMTKIKEEDIIFKRVPSGELSFSEINKVIGKIAACNIAYEEPLRLSSLKS